MLIFTAQIRERQFVFLCTYYKLPMLDHGGLASPLILFPFLYLLYLLTVILTFPLIYLKHGWELGVSSYLFLTCEINLIILSWLFLVETIAILQPFSVYYQIQIDKTPCILMPIKNTPEFSTHPIVQFYYHHQDYYYFQYYYYYRDYFLNVYIICMNVQGSYMREGQSWMRERCHIFNFLVILASPLIEIFARISGPQVW